MQQRVGISAFALKITMVVLMLADHLAYFLPHIFPIEMRFAGRLVAPTFAFLMCVSLVHTRDRGRYLARLAGAGIIMLLGSMALARALGGPPIFNTIFLSLALSAMLIDKIERIATRKGSLIFSLLVIAALLFVIPQVEGSFMLPLWAVIFYFLRERKLLMSLAYLVIGTGLLWLLGGMVLHYQQLQVFALIPILLYNGERGAHNTGVLGSKWFFYIFYPAHVWLLYVIRHLIFFA